MMDFQNRPGGKTGGGGVASFSDANRDRRERLRQLALETIDLNKDPYFMKNHLGTYECKLCLTLHNNEGSYLAHTQGKKHQQNLARRAAKEAAEAPAQPAPEKARVDIKKFVKIGRPGYKVTKQRDPDSGQQSLLFQIDYPEIVDVITPKHRFMSAYEQRVEPPDRKWQYLLFAAEPYETIAFKVPSREVDKDPKKLWTHWNKETKQFYLQFAYKIDIGGPPMRGPNAPIPGGGPPPIRPPVGGSLPSDASNKGTTQESSEGIPSSPTPSSSGPPAPVAPPDSRPSSVVAPPPPPPTAPPPPPVSATNQPPPPFQGMVFGQPPPPPPPPS